MVDWPGLLKWSLKYQDNYTSSKDIKPMDEATKKWLEEAFKAYSIDHVTKMKEIISSLPSNQDPLILLEDLSELIENLDAGLMFCQLKGMPVLVNLILNHKDQNVRLSACLIFQSIVQNSQENQKFALDACGFKLIERVLNEVSIGNKEAAFSALSAMIRGESLDIKREFIEIDGVEFLRKLLEEIKDSEKIRQKTLFLMKDLVHYDEMLNRRILTKEDLQENCEKFKGIVKKKLMEINFASYFEEIIKNCSKIAIETRNSAAYILGELLMKYKDEFKEKKDKWLESIKAHLKELLTENPKNEGLFDNEIMMFKDLAHEFMKL